MPPYRRLLLLLFFFSDQSFILNLALHSYVLENVLKWHLTGLLVKQALHFWEIKRKEQITNANICRSPAWSAAALEINKQSRSHPKSLYVTFSLRWKYWYFVATHVSNTLNLRWNKILLLQLHLIFKIFYNSTHACKHTHPKKIMRSKFSDWNLSAGIPNEI